MHELICNSRRLALEDELSGLRHQLWESQTMVQKVQDECGQLRVTVQGFEDTSAHVMNCTASAAEVKQLNAQMDELRAKLEVSQAAREEGASQVAKIEVDMDRLLQEVTVLRQHHPCAEASDADASHRHVNAAEEEVKSHVVLVKDLCHILVDIISELQSAVDVQSHDNKRLKRALLIESGAGAIIARSGGRDVISLLQKLRADLDASMQVQTQQRNLNKSREAEMEELKFQSERLCAKLMGLNGSNALPSFNAGSPLHLDMSSHLIDKASPGSSTSWV